MKRAIQQEAAFLLNCFFQKLRIDFLSLRTYLQIALAALLFAVHSYNKGENYRTNSRVDSVFAKVDRVADSLIIVTQYQERQVDKIQDQVRELVLRGAKREQAIKELVALLRANGITEKEALARIEKLNNTELAQYFSTLKDE